MVEQSIVRVDAVRVQNRNGVIFRGQRVTLSGEIIDPHAALTVRIQARGVGINVTTGQWWSVTGAIKSRSFINHLGFEMTEQQMEVEPGDARLQMPTGEHVVDYLTRNSRYKGIGGVTAELLWATFRERLFAILDEGDMTALADVVGATKASTIIQGWSEEGLSNSLQWLHSAGIPLALGRRVLAYFGKDTSSKIDENPYRLLSFSVGWKEVDDLARGQFGIEHDDERRLIAAIEETVYRRFSRGDTYVPHKELVAGLRVILKGETHQRDLIEKAIEQSEATRRLLFDREGNAYSLGASILENCAAQFIQDRIGRKTAPCDVDRVIAAHEAREGYGFKLNKEQREAVRLVAENDFACVTGGAGCGKTTVLKCIYDVLDEQGYHIAQLALAGKAVKRMMEATNRPGRTIASFIRDKNIPSRLAVVMDEASMVDLISFGGVTSMLPEDAKLVMVGDPHQLAPVGPGLILHCLTDLPGVPHVELKTAKRFGNKLANLANLVKDGVFPLLEQFDEEIRFIPTGNSEMVDRASNLYLEQPDDTIVLCATRTIAKSINSVVQKTLTAGRNPLRLWNMEFDLWEHTGFYQGDLVICTRNHWELGIQNGSMGRLIEVGSLTELDGINGPTAIGKIEWDDGEVRPLHEELLDSLELGYALTVHKSQGSQWRRVITCLPQRSRILDRSLIYTALTRSQKDVVLLGSYPELIAEVKREKAADRRRVGLKRRLRGRACITGLA